MTQGKKPNFILVGAAKTGTTSVYDYLKQHPEIYIPRKETFYFISDLYKDNHLPYPKQRPHEEIVFDADTYLRPFQDAGEASALGEVATGYLFYHDLAIPRIKSLLGDVKILAILRNPVERTYSGYTFFSRDLHEKLSFEEALAAEPERIAANWDFMWHYIEHSKYAESVRAYQQAFSEVKIMLFDDLRKDPAGFMAEMFAFLEVDPSVEVELEMKNVSGAPKSKAFQTLITQENPVKRVFRPLLRSVFSRERRHKMRQWLKSKNVGEKDRMTAEQYNALLANFSDDVKALEGLIDRDLSHWLAPK